MGESEKSNGQIYPEFELLTSKILSWAQRVSHSEKFAYIETEYFSGGGAQAAAAWMGFKTLYGPARDAIGPINQALKVIGVKCRSGMDEFETLGLGKHRSNRSWIGD